MTAGEINIEKAFELIQKGNDLETEKNFWKSALALDQAQSILSELSDVADDDKIVDLYRQQSIEYLLRARKALIKALLKEAEADSGKEKVEGWTPTFRSLDDDQLDERLSLFGRLFAREPLSLSKDVPVFEKESSLEQRLMELNQSLPQGFKTSEQRINEINRGLNRLGLSLYSSSDEKHRMFPETPKSESEQVDEIIAQAKDEVVMQAILDPTCPPHVEPVKKDSEDFLLDEDEASIEDDLSEDDDNVLTVEHVRAIKEKVSEAISHLVELNALFELVDDDDDGKDEVTFDQARGKKCLRDARLELLRATQQWSMN